MAARLQRTTVRSTTKLFGVKVFWICVIVTDTSILDPIKKEVIKSIFPSKSLTSSPQTSQNPKGTMEGFCKFFFFCVCIASDLGFGDNEEERTP
jgi:hypothetical protein